jgi:PLP dependent protein
MAVSKEKIAENLAAIQGRLDAAAQRGGRNPRDVTLVAVTKAATLEETRALLELGVQHLGENRLEVVLPKMRALKACNVQWHMIGNVQRRKARDVAANFDTVDAVDRLSLAQALQQRCEAQDRRLKILLEVNVSGEESKHGFAPADLGRDLNEIRRMDRLRVAGLMTMAPRDAQEGDLRKIFRELRRITDAEALRECSMGMSRDFEIALEEGATQVRIGGALFAE